MFEGMFDVQLSPFHDGEIEVQDKFGARGELVSAGMSWSHAGAWATSVGVLLMLSPLV